MVDINPMDDNILDFGEEERPPSEQLVELHIYLVPKEKWLEKRKLAKNHAVDHTISVGFVRVLPQTHLSDLRKEMDRQLGVDSVPQNFVFLRSVGRNFTQVRPRQEVEMKVKNFMPPYAPEPELYLKDGPYTGPSTWSQGEDSGLEESLADSNSQRSHDRATPESLSEDPILPKIPDLLNVPQGPLVDDTGGRSKRPPMMAIAMATNDPTTNLNRGRRLKETPGIQRAGKTSRLNESGYRVGGGGIIRSKINSNAVPLGYGEANQDLDSKNANAIPKPRPGLLSRRQIRASSKERGGSQLPTWAETRTTRLRRSRALGEDSKVVVTTHSKNYRKPQNRIINNHIPEDNNNKDNHVFAADAEDEAEEEDGGKYLMERIRATSRTLRSRLSSYNRQNVTDTGAGPGSSFKGDCNEDRLENHVTSTRYKGNYNGVYTMHTRKNLRGGASGFEDDAKNQKDGHDDDITEVSIENTSIGLVEEDGTKVDMDEIVEYKGGGRKTKQVPDDPEIVHLHMLAVDGVDARGEVDAAPKSNLEFETDEKKVQEENGNENVIEEVDESENIEKGDRKNRVKDQATTRNEKLEVEVNVGENTEDTKKVVEASTEKSESNVPEEPTSLENSSLAEESAKVDEDVDGNQQDEGNSTEDGEMNFSSDLQEGHLVNRNGKLTIEVEVKELDNDDSSQAPTPATAPTESLEYSSTPQIEIDENIQYDSYRVYSEQNLPTSTDSTSGRMYSKAVISRTGRNSTIAARNEFEKQTRQQQQPPRGIYLRRLEHRDRSSEIRRTQSDGSGLATHFPPLEQAVHTPSTRSFSQNRRGGRGSEPKWTMTSSMGDLTENQWDGENDKERMLLILDRIRTESRVRERQREELLRHIKQLQSRANQRKEQGEDSRAVSCLATIVGNSEVREMWRKRYMEAKKITPRLEEECSRLRQELEKLHRELLAKVQAGVWALLTISGKTERPSNKLSYKIMIARSLQEIEDLTRRVEGTRLKLHTEMKLRAMAEKDVRNLREELLKKKIQVTLTRNQEQAALGNGIRQQYFISAV